MGVPRDIARRMDKTRGRRVRKQRNTVARATRREIKGKSGCPLFGLVLCILALAACGPNNLNNAPLTPVPAASGHGPIGGAL